MIRTMVEHPLATLLFLGLVLLGLWMAIPQGMPTDRSVSLPDLTPHALEHEDAREAWTWVRWHGLFCKWSCPDGRTRFVCGMRNGRWAIVIKEGQRLVTAYTADQSYAIGLIDGCSNPWQFSHP